MVINTNMVEYITLFINWYNILDVNENIETSEMLKLIERKIKSNSMKLKNDFISEEINRKTLFARDIFSSESSRKIYDDLSVKINEEFLIKINEGNFENEWNNYFSIVDIKNSRYNISKLSYHKKIFSEKLSRMNNLEMNFYKTFNNLEMNETNINLITEFIKNISLGNEITINSINTVNIGNMQIRIGNDKRCSAVQINGKICGRIPKNGKEKCGYHDR